jgi:hypothetical protein
MAVSEAKHDFIKRLRPIKRNPHAKPSPDKSSHLNRLRKVHSCPRKTIRLSAIILRLLHNGNAMLSISHRLTRNVDISQRQNLKKVSRIHC